MIYSMWYIKIMYKTLITIGLTLLLGGLAHAQVVDKVVAVVNNEVITQRDLEQELAPIYAQYKSAYQPEELETLMEEARLNILKQMIEDRLMLQEAREIRIQVSDEEIEEKLEWVKVKFESEIEFMDVLEMEGITVRDLEAQYREQIMVAKIIGREVTSKVMISPQEVSDYYTLHPEEFIEPEKVKVLNILIRPEKPSEKSWGRARRKAEALLNRLRDGADFRELARDYSQGPNPDHGGDMGYLAKGQMLTEIDEVIFNLGIGEVSGLIKTKLGYHILKIEDRTAERVKEPSEVQDKIEEIIFKEKFEQRFKEWMEKLKENAYISIR